jgi:hypothetical protein
MAESSSVEIQPPACRAERIMRSLRRSGLEHDAAAIGLDDPDVGFHFQRWCRECLVPQTLEEVQTSNAGHDFPGD